MRVPENEKRAPLSVQYLAHALQALDSDHQDAVMPPLRMLLKDRAVLAEVAGLIKQDELELDLDTAPDAAPQGGGNIDLNALSREFGSDKPASADLGKLADELDGPRFRIGIVRAIARFDEKFVNEVLRDVLRGDESPAVRAAAARAMSARGKTFAPALRRAWQNDDAGEVRQSVLRSLVEARLADADTLRSAAADRAAEVRTALAEVMHGAEIDAALRRELWVALVGDASQDVSSAAMSALRAHTD
ncbi:MAG: HEAT repeat domain-containing protein, partial [Phycisphaeraceae bacterium]